MDCLRRPLVVQEVLSSSVFHLLSFALEGSFLLAFLGSLRCVLEVLIGGAALRSFFLGRTSALSKVHVFVQAIFLSL